MTKHRGFKGSRRDFLKVLGTGTCGAAVHRLFAPVGGVLAFARPLQAFAAGESDTVLVVLNLSGGCSLNIGPYYSSAYRDRNPSISYGPENSIVLSNQQGLHPSLTGLKTMWDAGELAVLNLVGYANPNRSHAESTDIWHTGRRELSGSMIGWGARLTSSLNSPFAGISLSGAQTFGKGDSNPPRILSNLESFGEDKIFGSTEDFMQLSMTRLNVLLNSDQRSGEGREIAEASMNRLESNKEALAGIAKTQLPVAFPNTGLASRFKDAARLIHAGPLLGVKVIYLETGGYDTHSEERPRLTQLLNELNGAIAAFRECIIALGHWQKVVLATMSEFTRTMENASQGTDHGAAGYMLCMGPRVQGGIFGAPPEAGDIGSREYIVARHFNFSQVFGTIIGTHLGLDPTLIFPYPELAPTPYLNIMKA